MFIKHPMKFTGDLKVAIINIFMSAVDYTTSYMKGVCCNDELSYYYQLILVGQSL